MVGSRLNVICREARNRFIPERSDCGLGHYVRNEHAVMAKSTHGVAVAEIAGCPSNTMTLSAR